MLGMFWIALELSNPMVGLIRLSLLAKNLTAFKFGKVAKSGNAEGVSFILCRLVCRYSSLTDQQLMICFLYEQTRS